MVTDSVAEELSIYADQHRKPYGSYDADWNRHSAANPSVGREPAIDRGSSQISRSGIPSISYSDYQKALSSSSSAHAEVVQPNSPSQRRAGERCSRRTVAYPGLTQRPPLKPLRLKKPRT